MDENAQIGSEVKIETFIGRKITGTLYRVNPIYDHNFGEPQKEILSIGKEVKYQFENKQKDKRVF